MLFIIIINSYKVKWSNTWNWRRPIFITTLLIHVYLYMFCFWTFLFYLVDVRSEMLTWVNCVCLLNVNVKWSCFWTLTFNCRALTRVHKNNQPCPENTYCMVPCQCIYLYAHAYERTSIFSSQIFRTILYSIFLLLESTSRDVWISVFYGLCGRTDTEWLTRETPLGVCHQLHIEKSLSKSRNVRYHFHTHTILTSYFVLGAFNRQKFNFLGFSRLPFSN